jgi:hypothetical protein
MGGEYLLSSLLVVDCLVGCWNAALEADVFASNTERVTLIIIIIYSIISHKSAA